MPGGLVKDEGYSTDEGGGGPGIIMVELCWDKVLSGLIIGTWKPGSWFTWKPIDS